MSIKEKLNQHFDQKEIDVYFRDINKVLNVCKNSYKESRKLIILSDEYNGDQKLKMIEMIDVLYSNKRRELVTSDYDGKVYTQLFFSDFLKFINTNDLTMNEFKIILAVYEMLKRNDKFGNVLLSCNLTSLAKAANVSYKNINKTITSLIEKNILTREEKDLYLNYKYFFRGTKLDYDLYKDLYNDLQAKEDDLIFTE
ncbi:replication protein [Massilia agri]|uniref:Replication protein n=1 Tax=Massilia agri TaxID=1886785 RepID=A0ABT2AN49_9BURK|nr:replication protein [Massilia agri]MCS0597634.1 replication protein [Massilia agri]